MLNIKALLNVDLKRSNYDFNDPDTYKLLQSGNAAAIFQLESKGMRRVLTKLEPDCFEDIIALIALYRPGPLGSGMVDDFIKRKKGEQVADYFHDDLKVCLEPTYGVIVYQEQVMQISQIIGGYTLGGADLLRRAMGKKKAEEMAKHKSIFVEGALKKGYAPELADNLFELMAKFADYGFNKSHSAAYAVISYHTAYLKTHYISCFMAATLSSELDNTDKLYELYQDLVENEIELLPPDINKSVYRFLPIDASKIRYAMGAVKGAGQHAVEMIVSERDKNGEFIDFVDFCKRCYKTIVNKRTIENLVKAGAFDELNKNRAKLFKNINKILEHIENGRANENQASLFDGFDAGTSNDYIELEQVEEWHIREKLSNEKQALGYYFSGSLFEEYHDLVRKLDITPLSKYSLDNPEMQEFVNSRAKEKVDVCGVINYIGARPLKKGGKMYFVKIEDDAGEIEFIMFNDVYEEYKALIKEDEFVFIEGELTYDQFRNEIKITAKKIHSLDSFLQQYVMNLTLHIEKDFAIDKLIPMLSDNGVKINLYYNNGVSQCKLGVDKKFINNYDNIKTLGGLLNNKHWSIN